MRNVLVLLALLSTAGFGSSIHFHQGGWSTGGPLAVSLAGTDTNMDGALAADELTEFRAAWITPAGRTTDWDLSDLEPAGLSFTDLGDYLFFARNAEYSIVSTAFENEFLATVFDSQLFPVDSTTSPAQAVPEPGTFGLIGFLGFAALVRTRLRRE